MCLRCDESPYVCLGSLQRSYVFFFSFLPEDAQPPHPLANDLCVCAFKCMCAQVAVMFQQ